MFSTFIDLRRISTLGLKNERGIFIAIKEKALVDAMYLYSFGKYKIDFSALNLKVFDKRKLKEIL